MKYSDVIARCNPAMSHWELNELLLELERVDVLRVLEIGVHRGGSLRVWHEVFQPSLVVGVDDAKHPDARGPWSIVAGYSQDPTVRLRVAMLSDQVPFDFLFIDGGHSSHEVLSDWEMYSSLVRPGGIISLHDVHAPVTNECNVAAAWKEIQRGRRTKTIWGGVEHDTGIGVVYHDG